MRNDIPAEMPLPPDAPWYRYPLVWMVISGPAAVVVAGFATLWIAIRMPDPVITEGTYSEGRHIAQALAVRKMLPALAGRNHAATPDTAAVAAPPPGRTP